MRKLFTAIFVLWAGGAMAEATYALADFESIGMAVRGEHPEIIGGGNFTLDDEDAIKPFTREECEEAAKELGGSNGLYVDRETSALGRRACIELTTAKKYLRADEFWNIDLDKFFKDNASKFPERLRPSEAGGYSIFPLE
jgi:hypothetical protein